MKWFKIIWVVFCLGTSVSIVSAQKSRSLDNPFYVFNNGLNKQGLDFIPYSDQAKLLKKYGFQGIEHRETTGLTELNMAFEKVGLKVYTDYMQIDIDKPEPYLAEWKTVLPQLKGSGLILEVHIHSAQYKPSDETADEKVVKILQDLADFCNPYGIKLAIYHHVGFLAEKVEDSYRLAQKANRENIGSMFNLCHFLKTDSEVNLEKVVSLTLPKLIAVTISGADYGDTKNMGWDRLIQPLGNGTFEVYRLVELLADKGYKGPIGLQCYAIKGGPEDYLPQSSKTWQEFKQRYALKRNSLTDNERKEKWKLLFDGKSTRQWRGVGLKSFPGTGWKVVDGVLIACADPTNGGDIITKKQYGDFILKWEWLMETTGGNSGVKFDVQEFPGKEKSVTYGLEYQLLDDYNHPWMKGGQMKPNDYHTLGALYELYAASADKHPNALGLWNESMIILHNNKIEHWLNGKKLLEVDRSSADFKTKIAASKFKNIPGFGLLPKGYLLLQDHGGVVHFRNLKVKEF